MTLTDFLSGIANAIRQKTGSSSPIPAPNFANEILGIQTGTDTSDATATAGDILSGKTAYGASGKLVGTYEDIISKIDSQGTSVDLNQSSYRTNAPRFNDTVHVLIVYPSSTLYAEITITSSFSAVDFAVPKTKDPNEGTKYIRITTDPISFGLNFEGYSSSDYGGGDPISFSSVGALSIKYLVE